MAHIRAANIEEPGNGIGERQDDGILAGFAKLLLQGLDLVGGGDARPFQRLNRQWAVRGGRALRTPDEIHGIAREGLELEAGLGEAFLEADDGRARVQARVETDACAFGKLCRQPLPWLGLGDLDDLEDARIHLIGGLQGIAAVHEQGGLLGPDRGETCRASEAGQPREALGGRGHILSHVLVGARDEYGVDAETIEPCAQPRHAIGPECGICRRRKILEHDHLTGCRPSCVQSADALCVASLLV